MTTYFLLDPFELPYYFYRIRGGGMIYVLSIVVCIPSTFCPTWAIIRGGSITKVMNLKFLFIIKIINKNFRFSKHYILETYNQHLIELIFKPVLMYLIVFSYWR